MSQTIRTGAGRKRFTTMDVVVYLLILVFCFLCVTPFIVAISASFSNERTLLRNGYSFLPQSPTTAAYEMLFSTSQIFDSYKVSLFKIGRAHV
mgnify:CR=1 FL=1